MYSQKSEEFDLTSSQSNLNRLNKAMKTFLVNHAETAAGSSPDHFCMFCVFVCLLRCHSNNRRHVKGSQLSLPLSPHPVGLITTSCSVPQPLKKTKKTNKNHRTLIRQNSLAKNVAFLKCNSVTDSPAQLILLCWGSTPLLSQICSGQSRRSLPIRLPGTYFGRGPYRQDCTEEFEQLKHFRKKSLPRRKDSLGALTFPCSLLLFLFFFFFYLKSLLCLKKKKTKKKIPSGHPRGNNVQ